MKKENIWLIISIILVVFWMVLVFKLSGEISEVSGKRSGSVIESIIMFFNKNISETKLQTLIEYLQPLVRKIAHFLLYMLGGFLIYNLINFALKNFSRAKCLLISVLVGSFYAITDEIHQLFVPGRSGELRDVIIDSLGVILGIFIYYLLFNIFSKRINGRNMSNYVK